MASDGRCYRLHFQCDSNIGLGPRGGFTDDTVTVQLPGSQAKIMNIIWLLNSKAIHYRERLTPSEKIRDSEDIISILDYMRRHRIIARREQCEAVMDQHFWTDFTRAYDYAEQWLNDVGLQLHASPGPSSTPRAVPGSQRSGGGVDRSNPAADSARRISGSTVGGSNRTTLPPRSSLEPSTRQTGLYQRYPSRAAQNLIPSLDPAPQISGGRVGDSISAISRPRPSRQISIRPTDLARL